MSSFTLSTQDDQVFHDPTPEQISTVVEGLPPGGDSFVILADDADDLTFIQAIGCPAEGFGLEYQEGSLDRHFECTSQDLTAEHVVLALRSYQRGDAAWKTAFAWQHMDL